MAAEIALIKVDDAIHGFVTSELAPSVRVRCMSAVDRLIDDMSDRRRELDAIVLGSGLEEPIQAAQKIYFLTKDIPVMILTENDGFPHLKQALQFSPFLGSEVIPWSTQDVDELPGVLKDCIARKKQRTRYRTAILAAQKRLGDLGFQPPQVTHYLDRILDGAPIGVVHVNQEGECLALNRYASDVLRMKEREVLGTSILRWFPKHERGKLRRMLLDSAAPKHGARQAPEVLQIEPGECGAHYLEITASALADRNGRSGAIVILRDVTDRESAERERREALEALRHSEQRYRELVQMMDEAVVLTVHDGTIQYVNERFCEMFGYREDEIAGSDLMEMAHPDCAERVKHQFRKALNGFAERTESAWLNKAGETIFTLTSPRRLNTDGDKAVLLSVLTDITERTRAEDALRKNEHQLRLITDAVPVLIGYIDAEQRLVFANRALEQWFRTSGSPAKDSHLADVIGADAYHDIEGEIMAGLGGEKADIEKTVKQPGECPRYLRWSLIPDISEAEVRGLFVLANDLTDRKRVEERDRQQLVELCHSARLTMLGEMSSQLAHELAQPLAAIEAYAKACLKLIATNSAPTAEVSESLTDIWTQATRASEIMNRLRSFARKEVARSMVEINEVIRSVLRIAEVDSRCSDAPICLELSNEVSVTAADKTLIEQVVLNLVMNAMEAMEGLSRDQRKMCIKTFQDESYVHVAVSDFGPGLPDEIAARVFEPFFTTKPEGMGMGLSLTRSIIEAHGGRLWAQNEPSGGAKFEFTLPLRKQLSDADGRASYGYRPDSIHS